MSSLLSLVAAFACKFVTFKQVDMAQECTNALFFLPLLWHSASSFFLRPAHVRRIFGLGPFKYVVNLCGETRFGLKDEVPDIVVVALPALWVLLFFICVIRTTR